ncbi:hypothetical protein DER45DRAFT_634578 [Fusarium avenaceum]|nr:hypothetical protein DER45DRAFT_634578 [Fusarium avenaceum]
MPLGKRERLTLGPEPQHCQMSRPWMLSPRLSLGTLEIEMAHSSTAEEISPIDSRFTVHEEAIAEIEAIATNTGNTVEQHEHLINVIENKVDRFGLELKRTNLDVEALGESVDNMPVYDENNRKRTFLALSRDKMASTIENLIAKVDALTTKVDALTTKVDALTTKVDALDTKVDALDTKVDALAAKDASREQQLAAWTTAFDERLARLEFQHKFAETSQMLGRMDF